LHCGDGYVNIGRNLQSALLALRHKEKQRVIWVDSICINQRDLHEKNKQILLMREIYQRAEKVIIWMGEDENNSALGLSLMDMLASEEIRSNDYIPMGRVEEIRLPAADSDDWKALEAIFNRPWFSRVWVLQEFAVSSGSEVMLGNTTFRWERIYEAAKCVYEKGFADAVMGEGYKNVLKVEASRFRFRERNNMTILELMLAVRTSESTDPRDKIYALLGLSKDGELIRPNYLDDVSREYQDASTTFIKKYHTLDCLSGEQDSSHSSAIDLPSWVANWDISPSYSPLAFVGAPAGYCAGSNHPCSAEFGDDGRLVLKGLNTDFVAQIGDLYLPDNEEDPGGDSRVFEQWETMIESMMPYPTGEPVEQVYWRTLTANSTTGGQKAPDEYILLFLSWLRFLPHYQIQQPFEGIEDMDRERKYATILLLRLEECVTEEGFSQRKEDIWESALPRLA
jgi:Heterokaryon incompatibility protein (HET)